MLIKRVLRAIGNFIRNHHRNRVVVMGARLSNRYLRYYWNGLMADLDENGELHLLRVLAEQWGASAPITVFDVGANVGGYTELVKAAFPGSQVHCFEVVPQTRQTLARALAGMEGVIICQHGLSSSSGTLSIALNRANDGEARSVSSLTGAAKNVVECSVLKGDQYAAENGLSSIDLLKIDTEGHEMSVLEGFHHMLKEGRVRVIQFEYGTTWIAPRRFLHDAYSLLEPLGYRIGRLFPDGVFFKRYNRLEDDQFRMGNYVAIDNSLAPLIAALNLNPAEDEWKLGRSTFRAR